MGEIKADSTIGRTNNFPWRCFTQIFQLLSLSCRRTRWWWAGHLIYMSNLSNTIILNHINSNFHFRLNIFPLYRRWFDLRILFIRTFMRVMFLVLLMMLFFVFVRAFVPNQSFTLTDFWHLNWNWICWVFTLPKICVCVLFCASCPCLSSNDACDACAVFRVRTHCCLAFGYVCFHDVHA